MALSRFSLKRQAQPVLPHPAGGAQAGKDVAGLGRPAHAADGLDGRPVDMTATEKRLDAKLRIHRKLIDEINLAAVDKIPEKELHTQVYDLVAQYVSAERIALTASELDQFVNDILHEMTGLGPIEPLLEDDTITDILNRQFPQP